MTGAPPVTEIMGQSHLWDEFLVLMLIFFLNGIHIRENSVYPVWERSRKVGGVGGADAHHIPHQATPLLPAPSVFPTSPPPPHPSLFLHPPSCAALPLLCRAFRVCRPVLPAGDRTGGGVPEACLETP